MAESFTPAWLADLPEFGPRPGAKVVIVDNQVLSFRLLDGRSDAVFDFLFQDPRIVLQIGDQVINETLNSVGIDDKGTEPDRRGRPVQVGPATYRPGLPLALHQRMWEGQAALQAQGKLVLNRAMLPSQRIAYYKLASLTENACGRRMGPKDARMVADALVRRIPVFTADQRCRDAFAVGLAN
ncbi:MAG TPA: hypothetical protein VGC80_10320, partial [Acetobacteraceae bacterium]